MKFNKWIELIFGLVALVIARVVSVCFFDGSFWALLVVYVIAAWTGFWVEGIIRGKL